MIFSNLEDQIARIQVHLDEERKSVPIRIYRKRKEIEKDLVLKQMKPDVYQMVLKGKMKGLYYRSTIFLFPRACRNKKDVLHTYLHETQHMIQQRKLNLKLLKQLHRQKWRSIDDYHNGILERDADNFADEFLKKYS